MNYILGEKRGVIKTSQRTSYVSKPGICFIGFPTRKSFIPKNEAWQLNLRMMFQVRKKRQLWKGTLFFSPVLVSHLYSRATGFRRKQNLFSPKFPQILREWSSYTMEHMYPAHHKSDRKSFAAPEHEAGWPHGASSASTVTSFATVEQLQFSWASA